MTHENIWPEYLMIRDTGLHDDMGGGGQRIYTTAGRGYEKRKYVLETAALAQPASTGWRPMHEAPKDGTKVLIISEYGNQTVGSYREGQACWWGGGFIQYPHRWQPLPPAPESEPSK